MTAKTILAVLAFGTAIATLSGCVDEGPGYGGGYRTPGPVFVERDRRPYDYDRRGPYRGGDRGNYRGDRGDFRGDGGDFRGDRGDFRADRGDDRRSDRRDDRPERREDRPNRPEGRPEGRPPAQSAQPTQARPQRPDPQACGQDPRVPCTDRYDTPQRSN